MDTVPTTSDVALDAEPKKFIRTFESDKDTLKQGGTPELTPFQTPAPSERLVAASPIQPAPIPIPVPAPMQKPVAEPFPVAVSNAVKEEVLKTYASDFTKRVQETQASTATVLAAEQDAGAVPTVEAPQPRFSRSGIIYSIAGAVLLIAGGFGAYIAYVQFLSSSAPVVLVSTVTAPIFVDDREQVSGTGTALSQAIGQSVARHLTNGTVRLLYLGAGTSTSSVFGALQTSAPGILLRNIDASQSMAGVVNVGGTQSPFFILSVTAYGDTFAGMLRWEPLMPRDLAALFPPYPAPVIPVATTTATTVATSSSQKMTPALPAPVPTFADAVIANHDVRVYRDSSGRTVLLYGYWNQTTLIIARDTAAFTEILGRLATSRTQ